MTVQSIADSSNAGVWTTANGLDGFASLCCHEPHINLLSDPQSFSLTQRVGGIGPVVVAEVVVDSDVEIHCGALCSAYRVNVLHLRALARWCARFRGGFAAASVIPGSCPRRNLSGHIDAASVDWPRGYANRMRDIEVETVDNTGHWIVDQRPELGLRPLYAFLREH